ncbi:CPBP family intramembrane glutamic endopeptidase [Saccharibacillus alkalitolerans]|uniref:CPBP family intramembrane metalloprotease n=1 Tax=Saccharibacillus alkalitolerans TaxID=2705290 RepID=A0ABX0F2M6_9BACL|nr:CPBP family intramembrane glutamic endopeptidase [Saccharibacillus alkalitolerans]NGZ74209.1 CPBP family intramembrane metalloprotease [Saccharibacillus alkalitolerans]
MQQPIDGLRRPGWPEILVCLLAHTLIVFFGAYTINWMMPNVTVFYGLSLSALSALAGLGAFLAAYAIRIRNPLSFGLKRVSRKWLFQGAVFGVGVFVLAKVLVLLFIVAFVTGLATSYLFYRTQSIWPGVIVHIVNNALATALTAVIPMLV